ncbi:helix-turn-helix transcriptional regulator [Streptomonospora nanhaiensis]|uniref:Transcriptional regulator with XRE-family HTH domain n=1 Tax=Streptomonospora nanhaiensis TaxID=1323731 RepID=A0A853BWJ7_9ACTN|nr:helix-turn-helix transcriptional regulator [Streptomonospora nanhaiensis]MBV2364466.1 helix-turn-helix transcriptional regulator [Streptomonospora nanhaiensis]MBX9391195.1 helix-turn-helix transcriptional regulator [Streptomonospora nanhaiensis]NYI99186.1 transcriptional regulator with XRE-family HTH domain [Streptomonospora nanhaiensis]
MDKRELAAFLRARREAVRPADAGLPPHAGGRARRTPGLRREEVADLAGISVSYYERLEQARAPRPSPQVIDAIGRALRLSEVERAHLSRLAGHAPPARPGPAEQVPPGVLALLDRLGPVAAYVCDARHDIVAWNGLAAALVTDFGALPPAERNVLRLAMRPDRAVCSAPPEEAGGFEAQAAALSREALSRRPHDRALRRLVDEFAEWAPAFAERWRHHDVRPHATLRKRIHHGELGVLDLDCQTLAVPGTGLRVVLLSAGPGTPAHDRLARLQLRLALPEPSSRA